MLDAKFKMRSHTQRVPDSYDLVNLGRELLAQLSVPLVLNFTDQTGAKAINSGQVVATATPYIDLLNDVDELVATDSAFLLGPWISMARSLAAAGEDDFRWLCAQNGRHCAPGLVQPGVAAATSPMDAGRVAVEFGEIGLHGRQRFGAQRRRG